MARPTTTARPGSSGGERLRLAVGRDRPLLSLAATASSVEHRVHLPPAVRSALVAAALESRAAGDAVVTLTVPGRPTISIDLTPLRGNRVENVSSRRELAVEANVDRLDELVSDSEAAVPGLNTLGVADEAARGNGDAPVVVLSSGVSTEPPLDLRQWGWPERPDDVVTFLRARTYLPQHLSGRDVHFFYLGDVAGNQPALPSATVAALDALYPAICEAAGAHACVVWEDPPSAEPAQGHAPVPVVDVPQWAHPTGSPAPDSPCTTVFDIPTSLLFAPDSAVLTPEATAALRPLARRVVDAQGRLVVTLVRGHTSDAGPGDGRALSQQRARRTAEALGSLGIPESWILTVDGVGETQPLAPDHRPDGSPDPRASLNRRVEIVVADTVCPTAPATPGALP